MLTWGWQLAEIKTGVLERPVQASKTDLLIARILVADPSGSSWPAACWSLNHEEAASASAMAWRCIDHQSRVAV